MNPYNTLLQNLDLAQTTKPKEEHAAFSLDDLLKTSIQSSALNQQLTNLQSAQHKLVDKPLESYEKKKIERQVAFEQTKKSVSDWQGQIKRNR
jgi:U3 small nucleolar RNA-associated protein 14